MPNGALVLRFGSVKLDARMKVKEIMGASQAASYCRRQLEI